MMDFIELRRVVSNLERQNYIVTLKFFQKILLPILERLPFHWTFHTCLLLAIHAKGHSSTALLVEAEQLAGQLPVDLYTINFYIDK